MLNYKIFLFFFITFLFLPFSTFPQEEEIFTNSIGMKFRRIKPGSFIMGKPAGKKGIIKGWEQHKVTLTKGFYMQTTEVTQNQWKAIMVRNRSIFKKCGGTCPVESVSWDDAQEFIKKLNQKEGTTKYRLPTEAEWEYACRAGSKTAFSNGRMTELKCDYDPNLDKMGWYCGNSDKTTHPVAKKRPNAWGLYDMHGNVHEWCQDWYGDYVLDTVADPKGQASGSRRVFRGGSWANIAPFCRSDNRRSAFPHARSSGIGFRLVKTF
jgi:formylglycine-generating enzyme required for sulfatase activity